MRGQDRHKASISQRRSLLEKKIGGERGKRHKETAFAEEECLDLRGNMKSGLKGE